jgi:hypothetical protein
MVLFKIQAILAHNWFSVLPIVGLSIVRSLWYCLKSRPISIHSWPHCQPFVGFLSWPIVGFVLKIFGLSLLKAQVPLPITINIFQTQDFRIFHLEFEGGCYSIFEWL